MYGCGTLRRPNERNKVRPDDGGDVVEDLCKIRENGRILMFVDELGFR